jgi:hypothetical protein
VWASSPLLLMVDPTALGMLQAPGDMAGFVSNVGMLWLAIGAAGLLLRTVHLFFLMDVRTGLVWLTKILTDPFHDIKLYHRAPLRLLRGELIDPMTSWHQRA